MSAVKQSEELHMNIENRENYQCTQQEEFSIQGFDFVSKKCIDKENLATDKNPKMDRR